MNRGDQRKPIFRDHADRQRFVGKGSGWTGAELARRPKGEARKVRIARRLRVETAVTLKWIAEQLHMGTWTHVVNRLQQAKDKSEPNNQHELRLV